MGRRRGRGCCSIPFPTLKLAHRIVLYGGNSVNRTTKTVWYKRASIQGQKGTLQTYLASALSQRPLASERLLGCDNDLEQIGINLFQTRGSLLFGQFLSFKPGMRQPLITLENGTTAFNLETIAAEETDDGKKREFLESIGYFGVVGNHVLLVQTKALTSREFEIYLQWLLSQTTSTIPSGTVFTLDDPSATAARKKAARSNIRGVTIGTQLTAVAIPETRKGKAVAKYELTSGAFDALRGILGAHVFDKLSLSQSLEEDNIELQLTVRVKGRRVVSDDGQKFLRAVGKATRHMDPRDYELELDRNGALKGSDLKLHRSVNVGISESGGLVDELALMDHMTNWLQELNLTGLIDA